MDSCLSGYGTASQASLRLRPDRRAACNITVKEFLMDCWRKWIPYIGLRLGLRQGFDR